MLNRIRRLVDNALRNDESFESFYLRYMKKVQDQNIDREVRNQIRFGIFQLSHLDHQIEADYRKLVNEQNAKFN